MKAWCYRIVRADLAPHHSLYRYRRGPRSMALIRSSIWARASPPTPSRGARRKALWKALRRPQRVHVAVTAARCGSAPQRVGAGQSITHGRPVHRRRPSMHHGQRSGPFLTVLTRFHVFGRVYAPQHPWRANPSTFAPQMCFLCLLPTSSCVGWVSGSPNQNHHFTPYP